MKTLGVYKDVALPGIIAVHLQYTTLNLPELPFRANSGQRQASPVKL